MLEQWIPFVAKNFSMLMFGLAVAIAVIGTLAGRGKPGRGFAEQLFSWVSLLAAGVVGLYTFAMHVFWPEQTAAHIGWAPSPFQYEVGMADLAMGVLGVLAFRAGLGFRAATTIAAICWLGGDAVGHVRQMIVANNYAPGNAGPWLWSDILVPVVMAITMTILWNRQRAGKSASSKLAGTPRGTTGMPVAT
jgi:hypothetical protein